MRLEVEVEVGVSGERGSCAADGAEEEAVERHSGDGKLEMVIGKGMRDTTLQGVV